MASRLRGLSRRQTRVQRGWGHAQTNAERQCLPATYNLRSSARRRKAGRQSSALAIPPRPFRRGGDTPQRPDGAPGQPTPSAALARAVTTEREPTESSVGPASAAPLLPRADTPATRKGDRARKDPS